MLLDMMHRTNFLAHMRPPKNSASTNHSMTVSLAQHSSSHLIISPVFYINIQTGMILDEESSVLLLLYI